MLWGNPISWLYDRRRALTNSHAFGKHAVNQCMTMLNAVQCLVCSLHLPAESAGGMQGDCAVLTQLCVYI